MRCPCGATVPQPADPTARSATCPDCGSEVDLVQAADDATRIAVPDDEKTIIDRLIGKELGQGRYRIESVIGEGGMGKVYLGTQLNLNRRIAVKVLSDELTQDTHFVDRFKREAGVLAALDHPNIVSIFDVGEEDGVHYIVMAYVAGPRGTPASLRTLMGGEPMDESLALRLMGQICSALHYAHARGIVHRDIKPGNVLIDGDGNAQIADFGIARAGLAGEKTLTVPGTIMGSLKYMSPEQKLDSAQVDARSDLYSLGVVFYEMVTGNVPEGRFDLPSQMRDELDDRIDTIVDRVLQVTPDKRFQTAAEIEEAIKTITTEHAYRRTNPGQAAKAHDEWTAAPAPPPRPKTKPPPPPDGSLPSWSVAVWVVGGLGLLGALVSLICLIAGVANYRDGGYEDWGSGYGYYRRGRIDDDTGYAALGIGIVAAVLLIIALFVRRAQTRRWSGPLAWGLGVAAAAGLISPMAGESGRDTSDFTSILGIVVLILLLLSSPIRLMFIREDALVARRPRTGGRAVFTAACHFLGLVLLAGTLVMLADNADRWPWYLTIPVAIACVDWPGKRALKVALVRMGSGAVNGMRRAVGRPPLQDA